MKDFDIAAFENGIREYIKFHLKDLGFNITDILLEKYVGMFFNELTEDLTDHTYNFIESRQLPKFSEYCIDCIRFQKDCIYKKSTLGCGKQTQSDVDDLQGDKELEEMRDKEDNDEIRK